MRRVSQPCTAAPSTPPPDDTRIPRAWSAAVCLIKDCGGGTLDIRTWDARLAMRLHQHDAPDCE